MGSASSDARHGGRESDWPPVEVEPPVAGCLDHIFIVTGANGRLGRQIVERLLDRVPANRIGVSVRDPAGADALAARGVRIRHGDFDDADSLSDAFEGAERLLLVSSNAGARGGDPVAQHRRVIAAARGAGVERIVYTSHMGASDRSAFPPMTAHAATEALLAESGIAWTALRNGFYASSAVDLLGDVRTSGRVEAPTDGPVSWTAHADLAEAAAIILVECGDEGPTPPLTAARAVDLDEIARIAARFLERSVVRVTVSDSAFRDNLEIRGVPPAALAIALGLYRASRAGEFNAVDPKLEKLLGRPPQTVESVVEQALSPA